MTDETTGVRISDLGVGTPRSQIRDPSSDVAHQPLHKPQTGFRQRVATVEPRVDRDRKPRALSELHRREEVRVEGVHAARPDQADEMQCAAGSPHRVAQLQERRQPEEVARVDGPRDAGDVLRHHAARPEVQVADLTVADLSVGEANGESGGSEQRVRRARPESVPGGRVTQLDGVAFAAGAEAPTVEHDEDDRGARPTPVRHIEPDAI